MIALFTDFGLHDPYVGQLKAVLAQASPAIPVIDLLHEVPAFNAHAGAHLLSALSDGFPPGTVFIGVVDPGVGTERDALVIEADAHLFVGPDNGLFSVCMQRACSVRGWRIEWRPSACSNTFHGRDIFAPIAARLANGERMPDGLSAIDAPRVMFDANDLARVIYIDHYGNAWTGLRGNGVDRHTQLQVAGKALSHAGTFAEVSKGQSFWYVNSSGLVEIAVNRGSAADTLGLRIGDLVGLVPGQARRVH